MISKLFLGVLIILFSANLFGLSSINGLPFLETGIGVRSFGMGNSYTAITNDLLSIYYNPAGLSEISQISFNSVLSIMSLDRQHNFVSLGYNLQEKIGIGVSYQQSGVKNIESYTSDNIKGENFNDINRVITLGAGYKFPEYKISAGLNLKMIYSKIQNNSASGFGIDLGFITNPYKKMFIGASILNILTKQKWDTLNQTENNAPMLLRLGVGYKLFDDRLILNLDAVKNFERDSYKLNFGLEYNIMKYVAIRAGLANKKITAGLGLKYRWINIDYAFVQDKLNEGNSSMLALVFNFPEEKVLLESVVEIQETVDFDKSVISAESTQDYSKMETAELKKLFDETKPKFYELQSKVKINPSDDKLKAEYNKAKTEALKMQEELKKRIKK